MVFLRFLWRLVRRRPVIRMLFWIVLRLVRLFGWRRSVTLLFRQRRHFRSVAAGLWRTTIRLLRLGRSAWILIGWFRKHTPRLLRREKTSLQLRVRPQGRLLGASDSPWAHHLQRTARPNLSSRVARRRDELRRSVLAAVGVDPEWRPKRKTPRRPLSRSQSR